MFGLGTTPELTRSRPARRPPPVAPGRPRRSRDGRAGGAPGARPARPRSAARGSAYAAAPMQLGELGRQRPKTGSAPMCASGLPCSTSRGRRHRRPSPAGRTRRSSPRGNVVPSGRSTVPVGAAQRQLPAHVGLRLVRRPALVERQPVQGAAGPVGELPGANPGRFRNTQAPSTTAVVRSPSSSTARQPVPRPALPAARCCHCCGGQPRDGARHPLLVGGVGEVRAERAAAVVRAAPRRCPGSPARTRSASDE